MQQLVIYLNQIKVYSKPVETEIVFDRNFKILLYMNLMVMEIIHYFLMDT